MKNWEGKLHRKTGGIGGPVEELDLSDLIGATIQDIGFHPEAKCEGGFTIDYTRNGKEKRVILGFNELGMWKQWEGEKGNPSPLDLLSKRITQAVASDEWCDVSIEDDPLKLEYRFINMDDKVVLTLKLKEIKMLPEQIRRCFSKRYESKEKRNDDILMSLGVEFL